MEFQFLRPCSARSAAQAVDQTWIDNAEVRCWNKGTQCHPRRKIPKDEARHRQALKEGIMHVNMFPRFGRGPAPKSPPKPTRPPTTEVPYYQGGPVGRSARPVRCDAARARAFVLKNGLVHEPFRRALCNGYRSVVRARPPTTVWRPRECFWGNWQ